MKKTNTKLNLKLPKKLDPAFWRRWAVVATRLITKFSFIPDGPISRVTIDNTSSKDATNRTSLAPNKTYEITKFTIKEATTPDSARRYQLKN
ncbi:hypothetical protein PWA39_02355 [Mesomycoplasma ovipneumoniae ATCC 29419]|uniref:hypothetical protein n=1 Tax=Mesomycoplasma ovipneumoniae TaxID=29562 RepID=UPI00237F72B3|nr:hypothetical protein [Mesomycoplasma ovipneumoniae]WDV48352.1 hypothetical protein PWA39_02355 [Mesomycoplasma ovipneumoniae ATCC 29419]